MPTALRTCFNLANKSQSHVQRIQTQIPKQRLKLRCPFNKGFHIFLHLSWRHYYFKGTILIGSNSTNSCRGLQSVLLRSWLRRTGVFRRYWIRPNENGTFEIIMYSWPLHAASMHLNFPDIDNMNWMIFIYFSMLDGCHKVLFDYAVDINLSRLAML